MATLKYSRQRESIKEYLAQTKEHPTADMVYMHIRDIFPHISLGTVYRNLNLLVDQGEAIKLSFGLGADRFDGNLEQHHHFLCTDCSRVLDLDLSQQDVHKINEIAGSNFAGEIRGYSAFFYGKCDKCSHESRS